MTFNRLPDYGSKSTFTQDYDASKAFIGAAERAFVKISGIKSDKCSLDSTVLGQLRSSGCHWALGYPSSKRPKAVEEGSTMFISTRTTEGFRISGRAIGHKFDEDRDKATSTDIAEHPWKKT